MNFKRFHESKNLADLYNISKRALSLDFTTGDNMTVVIDGTKSSGNNIIDIKDTSFVLPAGTYTVKIKMVSGTITEISDGVYFGINRSDYGQRTTPGIKQIGDVGTRTFTLSNDTTITSFNIAPSYGSEGAVFDDATFECWMYKGSGSDNIPYEPYSSEVWHDIPHYIHNTSTDTLTTLPADIYVNDTTATVGLQGNMSQSSQPSPTTPIQPQETGEKTGNLFDYTTMAGTIKGYYLTYTGDLAETNLAAVTDYIPCNGGVFTLAKVGGVLPSICLYDSNKQFLYGQAYNTTGGSDKRNIVVDTNVNAKFIRFSYFYMGTEVTDDLSKIMLITGTTAPSTYIPYGYKIPILNNSQTTNVYLGEVESTRQIKKLVLTGTEGWFYRQGEPPNIFFLEFLGLEVVNNLGLCTHYLNQDSGSFDTFADKHILTRLANDGTKSFIGIRDSSFAMLNDFKSYLAQQYAAGTPVCVWYVLAEPTTGIVNEPLRKIGDYADEVSGISIPVTAGANTLSVDTTLQPSEVTVNYKGWHPVVDVHERTNGAWD